MDPYYNFLANHNGKIINMLLDSDDDDEKMAIFDADSHNDEYTSTLN